MGLFYLILSDRSYLYYYTNEDLFMIHMNLVVKSLFVASN
uniref:Uncharacterized protein n=1 Tax=Polysiphonia infestans TaxID=2006978 RepID=A0A1Z1MEF7_9FLOR|nr:hypothetical protein [Polysiphonia infestans]ARW64289.1 hypothetical protein [Polysiphonia infestans]